MEAEEKNMLAGANLEGWEESQLEEKMRSWFEEQAGKDVVDKGLEALMLRGLYNDKLRQDTQIKLKKVISDTLAEANRKDGSNVLQHTVDVMNFMNQETRLFFERANQGRLRRPSDRLVPGKVNSEMGTKIVKLECKRLEAECNETFGKTHPNYWVSAFEDEKTGEFGVEVEVKGVVVKNLDRDKVM
jgi:hypothetical protein